MFGFHPPASAARVCDCDDPASSILVTGDLFAVNVCILCAKSLVDEASGDVICMGCGIVREMIISEEADYRLFSDDLDSTARVRAEKVDERFTMSTIISATGQNKATLAKTQGRISKSHQEKKILDGFSIVQQYCAVLNVPDFVMEEAKNLHFTMGEKRQKHAKGCWTESMCAATILVAAKRAAYGITFKEVSRGLKIQEKAIRKNYAQLLKIVGASNQGEQTTESNLGDSTNGMVYPGRTSPSLLTNQYGAKLNLPYKVILTINSVAYLALPFLEGKKPSTVAAASIWVVVKGGTHKITESEIASVAGISPVTLKAAYNCLSPHLALLLPSSSSPSPIAA